MTYRPGDPTRTRQLLAALAQAPEPHLATHWAEQLRELTTAIHTTVGDRRTAALPYELIYHWRSELDRLLATAEHADTALWAQARTPGTWLDALLRLRVVLTHVTSKAYWSAHTHITYGEIDIERYLWGAR